MIPSAPLGTDAAAADRSGLGDATGATPPGGAAQRRFRFELAAHPGSVAQARRLAHARLTGWSVCADTCDNAALVISELVTNAIVHTASTHVVCELHDHDDMVRIAVGDEGCAPGDPHPSPQRPDEEHGRGLLLVDALCRAWGAHEQGSGLLVWAELARGTDTLPGAGTDSGTDIDAAPGRDPVHGTDAISGTGAPRGTAEPSNDLGWGARPKPGRPEDSGDDDPAEAHRHTPAHHRHRAADQPLHRTPEQYGHGSQGGPQQHGHGGNGTPEQHRHGNPEPYRTASPEQHGHKSPDQHRYRTVEQPSHPAFEKHRHRAVDQPLRRAPEQHRAGERP
ncbi:Histidine kinase-like ATPase domain-containing protein [Streptomyces sp. 2231.1]|nr:Histidine kinase-like ATPase domain-containing protein [Streptomyces sp. 2231.1]